MSKLNLTIAATNYDRLRALQDGRVRAEGIDLNYLTLPVEEIFHRQIKHHEFDLSEMSLSSYVLTLEQGAPFVAVPAFPSRYFRHQSMFVNRNSGIASPADLRGKRVGLPEYQITAGVWQRGMLEDEYGVAVEDMRFFTGGVEERGRSEKIRLDLPEGISVRPIGPEQTLSQMLAAGELDAVFSASTPSSFHTSPDVTRLFPDYKAVEADYYRRTGIFPIMHVVAIRRDVVETNPWVPLSLFKAFEQSLALAREDLEYRSSLKLMLPWLAHHLEETVEVMGEDFWKYGVEANCHTLETFLRYSRRQGLAKRKWSPEELFAETTTAAGFTV
ncbi:ABC transporter substrate-binding protein [Streptomyces hirsutus]|uniref:ABC transporter substrate-binding protein n=1 Tax=Streptomyces hirsutus TaxID=35620 RepID=A0ABZ1GGT7_9ACTN|nr:ABC transporter substrate-binding protein [Streptomyces hirsutus]WSD05319.1 ABC transporter substrate-binding protein [Streptomyces hirsutus]